MAGSQDFTADPRNATVKVYVDGDLVPRDEARVSVFDAGFVLGDGVWEGVRLHKGRLVFLGEHLDRLFDGARAIALDIGRSRAEVTDALHATLAANGMTDGVHVRLMVTRGLKKTPNQDPRHTIGRAAPCSPHPARCLPLPPSPSRASRTARSASSARSRRAASSMS